MRFEQFVREVRAIMQDAAKAKGYSDGDVSAPNELDSFMEKNFDGHALGECAYKLIRYRAKRDKQDLIKAAAWIFLEWNRD